MKVDVVESRAKAQPSTTVKVFQYVLVGEVASVCIQGQDASTKQKRNYSKRQGGYEFPNHWSREHNLHQS